MDHCSFNYWIEATRWELNQLQKYSTPSVRRVCLDGALFSMKHALTAANRDGCKERKALCLRVISWIRSAGHVSPPVDLSLIGRREAA